MTTTQIVENIIFIIQCFGVVSFAISGTIIAMSKRMDIFGVIILAITTTFGGGIIRDLCIGKTPPSFFTDWDFKVYLVITVAVSSICMILANFRPTAKYMFRYSNGFVLNLFDALGLAIFCVVGVNSVMDRGFTSVLLLTFVGGITGVGGGILRDIFVAEVPMVFRKHIYALPTIVGSLGYVYLCRVLSRLPAMMIVIAFITLMRILAAKFKWNLPVLYNKIGEISKEEELLRKEEEGRKVIESKKKYSIKKQSKKE